MAAPVRNILETPSYVRYVLPVQPFGTPCLYGMYCLSSLSEHPVCTVCSACPAFRNTLYVRYVLPVQPFETVCSACPASRNTLSCEHTVGLRASSLFYRKQLTTSNQQNSHCCSLDTPAVILRIATCCSPQAVGSR
jgi:hypothetical protein